MRKQKAKRIIKIAAITFALVFLFFAAAAAIFVSITISKAPQISELDAVPKGYRSSVLDDEGKVVLDLSRDGSNRVYVKLAEIPEDLQHAFVAIEDERFYKHHGIDIRGILRAFWVGIRRGGFSEGASTITQQLLKNNVFTAWTEEVSFLDRLERKIQEQYLALELEKRSSKEWILENYLNTINLGGGSYGVETASKRCFGKDVSELSLSECAVLAAITKSPSQYDPLLNPEANAERRQYVLDKMLSLGYIDDDAYREALADPVYDRIARGESGGVTEIMSYFEDALLKTVVGDLCRARGITVDEAWDLLYTGGLTIRSTENSSLQAICEEAAEREDLSAKDAQIAIVMIDNETGEVKAMIGGRGEKEGSLLLNRATDTVFQPGSVIKPIGEYAAVLESRKMTLSTVVDDAPYQYSNGQEIANADGRYGGRTTLREAIATSNNIVALKCFQDAGTDTVMRQLKSLGITTLGQSDKVEALALGATYGGVTVLEIAAAYGTLARGGEYKTPVYYTEVLDREGQTILTSQSVTERAVSVTTAALLTDAMRDVIREGTGKTAGFEGTALAGKSGTTTDACDLWFAGYSPEVTCAIWGGRDDHGAQQDTLYVQKLWRAVMEEAHRGKAEKEFEIPEALTRREICAKCGKLAVSHLCEDSLQGDMHREEIFAPGTAPTEDCDCHVEVKLCVSSGKPAGRYCRNVEKKVYLREGSEGTEDAAYVIPAGLEEESCDLHKHFWSEWFRKQEEEKPQGQVPQISPAPTPGEKPEPEEGSGEEEPGEAGSGEEESGEAGSGEESESEELSWWEKFLSWIGG